MNKNIFAIKEVYKSFVTCCISFLIISISIVGCVKLSREIKGNKEAINHLQSCNDDCSNLYSLCEDGKIDECIQQAEKFLTTKYDDDSFLFIMLAVAYYSKGDKDKAIDYFRKSLKGNYFCNCIRPKGDTFLVERAIVRFCISIVHDELGDIEKSKSEERKAIEILKGISPGKADKSYINKFKLRARDGLSFFSK